MIMGLLKLFFIFAVWGIILFIGLGLVMYVFGKIFPSFESNIPTRQQGFSSSGGSGSSGLDW